MDDFGIVVNQHGLVCDGATDDTLALSNLISNIGIRPVKLVFSGCSVLSNIIIPSNVTLDFTPGGSIKIVLSQRVVISGNLTAGSRQIFFGTGAVVFSSDARIASYDPTWWGVGSETSTDDLPALNSLVSAIPDYALVEFPRGITINISNTWVIQYRTGVIFRSTEHNNSLSNLNTRIRQLPSFSPGSAMIKFDQCSGCSFIGFLVIAMATDDAGGPWNVPGIGIDVDGFGHLTSTENLFKDNVIWNRSSTNSSWAGMRFSHTATQNNDIMHIVHNRFIGGGSARGRADFSINSGSNLCLTASTGGFLQDDIGKRIRIGGAGTSGILDTTILQVITGGSAVLAGVAATSVFGTYGVIGEGVGSGISIESGEAHQYEVVNNSFTGLSSAYNQIAGFGHCNNNNFYSNEIDYYIGDMEGSISISNSNSEASRQGLVLSGGNCPVRVSTSRFANNVPLPSAGYITIRNGAAGFVMDSNNIDIKPPSSTTIYDFSGCVSRSIILQNNRYSGGGQGVEYSELGIKTAPRRVTLINERGDTATLTAGIHFNNQPVCIGTVDGSSGFYIATTQTFSVSGGSNFMLTDSGDFYQPTTISRFDNGGSGGSDGALLLFSVTTPNITFSHGSGIRLKNKRNATLSTDDQIMFVNKLGVWYELCRSNDNPRPLVFSALPAAEVGTISIIKDSVVNTWGSVVSGGGSNVVRAWFNGQNWTVIGA